MLKIDECKKVYVSNHNIELLDELGRQHSISRTTVLNSLLGQLDFNKFRMGFEYDKKEKE